MLSQQVEERIEDSLRKLSDAANRHDVIAICGLYSENVVIYGPPHPEEGTMGRNSLKMQYETFFTAFPDLRLKLSNIMIKPEAAWLEWEATGTHRGILPT